MRKLCSALLLSCMLFAAGVAQAVTVTFDELPPTPVDQTGVTVKGLTFTYDETAAPVQLGSVFGADGIISPVNKVFDGSSQATVMVDFYVPFSQLIFDFVLTGTAPPTPDPLVPAVRVLFQDILGQTVADVTGNATYDAGNGLFSGSFSSSGVPFTTALITFDPQALSDAVYFQLDNLVGTEAVPEPGTILLVGLGLTGMTLMAYRRNRM